MGGGLSIEQKNSQSIYNNIAQESSEVCSVAISANSNISITANNSTLKNLNFDNGIVNNASSCALKASLQTTLLNSLKNKQSSTQVDIPGPFTILGDLIGSKDSINESNSQTIANESTQLMNSMCQNPLNANQNISLIVNNTTVDGLNKNNLISSNKFQCVIDNMSRFYAQNDESNTQIATQVRIDGMIFIIIIIVVGIVAVIIAKEAFKSKKGNSSFKEDNAVEAAAVSSLLKPQTVRKPPPIPNPVFNKGVVV